MGASTARAGQMDRFFLLFHRQFVYDTDILKKKIGPSLRFLAAGTTDTKFRRSTGVATANSTNKYQKYK